MLCVLSAIAVAGTAGTAAVAAVGGLEQKRGRAGCVSDVRSGDACVAGRALKFPEAVLVSPDGRSVYVAAQSGGVAIFDRVPGGGVRQKRARAGCVSQTVRSRRLCRSAKALRAPIDLAVSSDGRSIYVAALGSDAVAVFRRDVRSGSLTQLRGRAGCASLSGSGGLCSRARGLKEPKAVAVSPDDNNVYAAGGRGGVVVFDRDASSGAITQKAGRSGCVDGELSDLGGGCRDGDVSTDEGIAVSPDGRNVYVASGLGLIVFDRDSGGALTRKPGALGCVSETQPFENCTIARAVSASLSLQVSADGKHVYVASLDGVVILDRDIQDGTLSSKPAAQGCVSQTQPSCVRGRALAVPWDIALSPDGLNVYVAAAGSDALAIFERDAASGMLTQKPRRAGCVSKTGMSGRCANGRALDNPHSVIVSPDGRSVYVTSADVSAVAVFDRR